jgi:hypothetical protein
MKVVVVNVMVIIMVVLMVTMMVMVMVMIMSVLVDGDKCEGMVTVDGKRNGDYDGDINGGIYECVG